MADKQKKAGNQKKAEPVVVKAKVRREPPKRGPHNTTPEQRKRGRYYGELLRTAAQPQSEIFELVLVNDKPTLKSKGYQKVATRKEFMAKHPMQGTHPHSSAS